MLNVCKIVQVVMSQATHLYFDHPYEPDPEERGYYWAPRFTDTRKTFGFMPENLYNNADVARSGQPLTEEQVCGKDAKNCVKLEKPENIVGKVSRFNFASLIIIIFLCLSVNIFFDLLRCMLHTDWFILFFYFFYCIASFNSLN